MDGKFSLLYLQKKHNAYDTTHAQKYLLNEKMDTANLPQPCNESVALTAHRDTSMSGPDTHLTLLQHQGCGEPQTDRSLPAGSLCSSRA